MTEPTQHADTGRPARQDDYFCDCLDCHKPLNAPEVARSWVSMISEPSVKGLCFACFDRRVAQHARVFVAHIDGSERHA